MSDVIDKKSLPLRVMPGDEISTSENRKDVLDRISHGTGIGTLSTAIGDNFYGINHRQTPGAIQINKDFFGLTFFTRPRLNLSSDNIRFIRKFYPLLTNNEESIPRIIRCLLDPSLVKQGIKTQFVDSQQAFIPLLTNNLLSMSGWQDIIAPTFTSEAGVYQEVYTLVDGVTDNYTTYDITANFRNLPGDPITLMMLTWINYAAAVFEGKINPYPRFIKDNEIDYNTRIYRLVLDSTKTTVQKIAATGAAFPVNAPIGAAFNYESDKPINGSNDQISITFKAVGAQYQDDILIDEFNRSTQITNDMMSDKYRENYYTKVPIEMLSIFNNRGYPRIDPYTYELEWWVSNEEYKYFIPAYENKTWVNGEDVNGSRILVPKF